MHAAAVEPKTAHTRKRARVSETGGKAPAPSVEVTPAALDADGQFFAAISRLPPDTSAEKIGQLYVMHAQMTADRVRRAYDLDMLALQSELPVIAEKGKTSTGSYARYEDIIEIVRPICLKHGFTLTHRTEADRDRVRVTAILAHKGGHREQNSLPLPHDTSDGKSAIHAEASAVSYGKRITAVAILGIVTRGDDDDAKAASQSQEPETLSKGQQTEILQLIADTNANLDLLLQTVGVASLQDVLAKDFASLRATIRARAKNSKGA